MEVSEEDDIEEEDLLKDPPLLKVGIPKSPLPYDGVAPPPIPLLSREGGKKEAHMEAS